MEYFRIWYFTRHVQTQFRYYVFNPRIAIKVLISTLFLRLAAVCLLFQYGEKDRGKGGLIAIRRSSRQSIPVENCGHQYREIRFICLSGFFHFLLPESGQVAIGDGLASPLAPFLLQFVSFSEVNSPAGRRKT